MPENALAPPAILPPFSFRLPKPGAPDPHFGFSRSFYYALENRKIIKLIRVKQRGKKTGVTLVPYKPVRDFLEQEAAK